jgi:HAD superfamily hydrolase (TIGR01459 family)
MSRSIEGLSEIASGFDIFLVDQFGVLHDGRSPYPGAAEALAKIKSAGKRIALVSNSAKRAASNLPRMRRLGFSDDLYHAFITSGEAAFALMKGGLIGEAQGRCAYVFAIDADRSFIDGTGLVETADPSAADLVIIAGSEAPRVTLEDYRKRIEPLIRRKLPALCLNPDKLMLVDGTIAFAPGAIADLYVEMGGDVRFIGKPYPDIYRIALEAVGAKGGERILCIGDSVEHDIAGAKAIGASSLLILGGILREADEAVIEQEIAAHGARPDFTAADFRW